jgi:Fic family protein
VRYFLEGVRIQAAEAVEDTQRLLALRERCRNCLMSSKARPTAIQLLDRLFVNPYITAKEATKRLGVSDPTARAAISDLLSQGILVEVSERKWGKLFLAEELLSALRGHDNV